MAMDVREIASAGISIGVAVLVLTVMVLIITAIQGETPDASNNYGNQSLTWAGNATEIPWDLPRVVLGSVVLYNNGSKVNQGTNYTVTSDGITILNSSGGAPAPQSEWVTDKLNVSFSYLYGSSARNTTEAGLQSQETFSSFIPLVALAIIGGLIIGIVLRYYKGGN